MTLLKGFQKFVEHAFALSRTMSSPGICPMRGHIPKTCPRIPTFWTYYFSLVLEQVQEFLARPDFQLRQRLVRGNCFSRHRFGPRQQRKIVVRLIGSKDINVNSTPLLRRALGCLPNRSDQRRFVET